MTFWPDGFWTQFYGAATLFMVAVAFLFGANHAKLMAAVILGNWAMTRIIHMNLEGIAKFLSLGATDFISIIGLILVGVSLSTLTCSAMLAFCIGFYCLHMIGFLNETTMWAWTEPFGYVMLLTLLGESINVSGALAGHSADTARSISLVDYLVSRLASFRSQ